MDNTFRTSELIATSKLAIGDGYRAKNTELSKTGLPFARAGNIDNGFHFKDADCFPIEDIKKVGDKISRPGDVVFTSKGTVGRFAFVSESTQQFVFSPQLCYWRSLDWDFIHPRYLYYWMNSKEFWFQASGVKGQTDMADYVNLTDQRHFNIKIPDINEQCAIASILGSLDDKIELNRQTNRTLEQMAQALYKSWFVDFDPVTAKAAGKKPFGMSDEVARLFPDRFVESEMGMIPEGWKVGSIRSIAEYVNGKNFTNGATGTGKMVIRIAELNSGPSNSTIFNSIDANNENIAFPGDLLFSWSGSLDVYRWFRDEALVNQHIFKVIPKGFPQWYVHFNLIGAMPFFQGIASDKATTMGHIKREHLEQWQLALVPNPIIKNADIIVQPYYNLIFQNERENIQLGSLRDLLLPRLLSGEIRLSHAQKLVSEAV